MVRRRRRVKGRWVKRRREKSEEVKSIEVRSEKEHNMFMCSLHYTK